MKFGTTSGQRVEDDSEPSDNALAPGLEKPSVHSLSHNRRSEKQRSVVRLHGQDETSENLEIAG